MEWEIAEKSAGLSIRHFLKEEKSFSRRILKSIINDGGAVELNGRCVKLNERLNIGDNLVVKFPKEEKSSHMKPENISLDIIYEDEFLLVVNKPAEMATIPSYHHPSGTLANAILAYYEKKCIPYTVHIVTRLDRGTSGLVLIAKHRYSHSLLSSLQKKGEIKRKYQAIMTGILSTDTGIITKRIGRKDGSIIERTVREDGREAITHYKTIKKTINHTFVDIELETGRTHQIRVHFSSIGHPLAGDDLYGGSKDLIKRQALHCNHISFLHPFRQKSMSFSSSIPKDMEMLLDEDATKMF